MAQSGESRDYFSLAKGLITEAPYPKFPVDGTVDELNMILNKDGSRERRPGIDYEASHVEEFIGLSGAAVSTESISVHRWNNVANNGNLVSLSMMSPPILCQYLPIP